MRVMSGDRGRHILSVLEFARKPVLITIAVLDFPLLFVS
jgi:hypothetical protein